MKLSYKDLQRILTIFLSKQWRFRLWLGIAMAAVVALAGIALLGLSGWFITAAALAGFSTIGAVTFNFFVPSAGIRLLAIGRTFARYGERLTTHDATLTILASLRLKLFYGWAERQAARYLTARPARLLFRLTADIDVLDTLYLRVFVPTSVAIITALVVGVALSLIKLSLGFIIGGVLLIAGLSIPLIGANVAFTAARRRMYGIEAIRARVIDFIAGQADLLMAGRLKAQAATISRADQYVAAVDDQLNKIEILVGLALHILSSLLFMGTLLAVAWLSQTGIIQASSAAFALFLVFVAIEPFLALRRGAIELSRALLAARRVAPRLETPKFEPQSPKPRLPLSLQLIRAGVIYEGAEKPALDSITLSLGVDEKLAIIGESGAGKSSLLSLLAQELTPSYGSRKIVKSTLLTQKSEIFTDTIRNNLLIAKPTATDKELYDVLEAVGLLDHIKPLPQRLETRLGEGGLGFSGGQLRRLALARLFLCNTPLWLLDEPTEGLDSATAIEVMNCLAERARGHALVIASHSQREAKIVDRLALIKAGRIINIFNRGQAEFAQTLALLHPD